MQMHIVIQHMHENISNPDMFNHRTACYSVKGRQQEGKLLMCVVLLLLTGGANQINISDSNLLLETKDSEIQFVPSPRATTSNSITILHR